MTLVLKNVSYSYTDKNKQKKLVISNLNMEINNGEFISIVGRSGTGKSTILRLMTGLIQPDEGNVQIDKKDISLGNVGYMPQKDLLLPWRTILDNIMLASEIQGNSTISKDEARVWLQRVGLSEYENALPKQLSGGMRQRAAFLRTLLTGKDVLLLDESFGALDALTKKEMQSWLLSIWRDTGKTIVFITHDLEEAIFLSDKILLLHQDYSIEEISITLSRPRKLEMLHSEKIVTLRQELEKKIAHETIQKFSANI